MERRRWIYERRFLHALNYCVLLPGPEAQQLATYIGWLMHRTWFTFLPSFLFILAGGPLVESTHGRLQFTAPLTAITAAVVGVIASLALFFIVHIAYQTGAGGLFGLKVDLIALGSGATATTTGGVKVSIDAVKRAQVAKAVADAEAKAKNQARIDNNFWADSASSSPVGLQTSAGVLSPNPHRTTTVLGRWQTDMKSVINGQLHAPKS